MSKCLITVAVAILSSSIGSASAAPSCRSYCLGGTMYDQAEDSRTRECKVFQVTPNHPSCRSNEGPGEPSPFNGERSISCGRRGGDNFYRTFDLWFVLPNREAADGELRDGTKAVSSYFRGARTVVNSQVVWINESGSEPNSFCTAKYTSSNILLEMSCSNSSRGGVSLLISGDKVRVDFWQDTVRIERTFEQAECSISPLLE